MKKITLIMCLILSFAMLLIGCNSQTNSQTTSEESSENIETSEALELIANGEAKYGLVRAFSMSNDAIKAVGELYNEISKVTGVSMQIVTDDRVLDEGVKEILIGNTTRKESSDVSKTLKEGEYAIEVVGNKIVIVSNEDETLATAIKAFTEQCLNEASTGKWTVKKDLSIKGNDSLMLQKMANRYIPEGDQLVAKTTLLQDFSISTALVAGVRDSSVSVQGGCVAKGYLYSFFIATTTHDKAWVVKTNIDNPDDYTIKALDTDVLPGESNVFGHAGDAVYIPDKDLIVVVTSWRHLAFIDPDTLEELGTISTKEVYGGISYDKYLKQIYFVGQQNVCDGCYRYDAESGMFLNAFSYEYSLGYIGQGITCDGTYLYMLEMTPNHKTNKLRVYDIKTMELVHVIDLGIAYETENIDYYNGAFYVTCNNDSWTGSLTFKVEITVK